MSNLEPVYSYVRVSRDRRDQENHSPGVQKSATYDLCMAKRLPEPIYFYDLGVSGGIPIAEREGGKMMIEAARAGPCTIIVTHQDRLFRDSADALNTMKEWLGIGVKVILMDVGIDLTTPAGRLMFGVMAVFAQFTRETIQERTQETMDYKRDRGEQISRHAPYGSRFAATGRMSREGKPILEIVPDENELRVIAIVKAKAKKGWSYRHIAAFLDEYGILPRGGGLWAFGTVAKIMKANTKHRKKAGGEAPSGVATLDQACLDLADPPAPLEDSKDEIR